MKRFSRFLMIAAFVLIAMMCFPALAEETETAKTYTIDLTGIIIAMVGLIFNALLVWLGQSVLPKLRKWLEAKTDAEQRKLLWEIIEKTVEAAEQMIGKGKGTEKMEFVRNYLYSKGYTVDITMIEAAVKEMNKKTLKEIEQTFTYVSGETVDSEEQSE